MKEHEDRKSEKEDGDRFKLSDFVKELASSGLAGYFLTEEVIRSSLKDLKIPKETLGGLVDGANRKKDEFYEVMAKEFGKFLSKIDMTQELSKFLEKHEIKISIHFEPKAKQETKKDE